MTMELHTYLARLELERTVASPDARFRNEWRTLVAARGLERRLRRERGRLEIAAPVCCGHHTHPQEGLA
jgi:hypothetical protein